MANVLAPNGFQIFRRLDGGSPTAGFEYAKVALGDTTPIGYGDPVTRLNTGYVARSAAGTTQFYGIFYGCEYLNTAIGRMVWSPNWPGASAGTDPICYICTDPQTLFVAQSDGSPITFADIGANINVVIGTPATTAAGGFSTSQLGQSTLNTTDTLPFRIVGLLSDYVPSGGVNGTDDASNYNKAIVQPNFWDRRSLTGI